MPATATKAKKPGQAYGPGNASSNYFARTGLRAVQVGFTAEEHKRIKLAAFHADLPMSQFLRKAALAAAETILKKMEK